MAGGAFFVLTLLLALTCQGAPSKVSGGAYFYPENKTFRASFSMDVSQEGSAPPAGWLKYYYTRNRMNFVSTAITSATFLNNTATIAGTGTVNGKGSYTFTATVTDAKPDLFGIVIKKQNGSAYYSVISRAISGGDLVVQIPQETNQPPVANAG